LADVEDDKQWRADVLLTYLPNPGTAVYVGYTASYRNLGLVGSPPEVARRRSPDTSIGRQVFVKLSYLLRFLALIAGQRRASLTFCARATASVAMFTPPWALLA